MPEEAKASDSMELNRLKQCVVLASSAGSHRAERLGSLAIAA